MFRYTRIVRSSRKLLVLSAITSRCLVNASLWFGWTNIKIEGGQEGSRQGLCLTGTEPHVSPAYSEAQAAGRKPTRVQGKITSLCATPPSLKGKDGWFKASPLSSSIRATYGLASGHLSSQSFEVIQY